MGDKKVAFFMRKGADCLSKWVGESERQLRLLFDQVCVMLVDTCPRAVTRALACILIRAVSRAITRVVHAPPNVLSKASLGL